MTDEIILESRIEDAKAEIFILTMLIRDGIENGFNDNALRLQCDRADDAVAAVTLAS